MIFVQGLSLQKIMRFFVKSNDFVTLFARINLVEGAK